MTRKIFFGALIFLIGVTIFSAASAKKNDTAWRLDGTSSADMPRNFRLMSDAWHVDFHGKEPTRENLDELRVSASGQPSQAALKTVYDRLREIDPNAKIFMVDLRQETHGYVNAVPVSLYVEHNAINAGKTTAEVMNIERKELKSLRGIETTFTPMGNADKKIFKPLKIVPRVILTEQDAAEKVGLHYVRFAAADMQFPAPDVVDDFVQFVAMLPDDAWLHFHCQAGHGRTTTFIVMYEIMKNPGVSLEEICKRQYLLGGSNLLLEPEGKDWYSRMSRDRAKKIRLFYDFVQGTRAEQIGLQWSEWLKEIKQ
ncbi:MAG: hypothetical protein IJS69_06480 [Selenomonadaceae bacterium]|nr:hypothetical protein [Selenomonadaceae bacterium]